MHMADALISPSVGAAMWAATAGLTLYSAAKLRGDDTDEGKVPLMGVLGAFVFAAQMINFTIPATGSSGHLGGGLLLAILLGPHAAFLSIASVLTVQALFFADGGLLALGCNIFNLGAFPCFLAYPLVYRRLAGEHPTRGHILLASMAAALVGLQAGAAAVVMETLFSGISELPGGIFLLLMLPIHLAIGIVEGFVTAAVVTFVWKARPEILKMAVTPKSLPQASAPLKTVLAGFLLASFFVGGLLSWFASAHPDGLEWSMARISGKEELDPPGQGLHALLANVQERVAFLPDYQFRTTDVPVFTAHAEPIAPHEAESGAWPAVSGGTSVAGLVGGLMTLGFTGLTGWGLHRCRRRNKLHSAGSATP